MWLKFVKDTSENKRFDVLWVDDDDLGQMLIDRNDAVRCLGPSGIIFEEAAPEDIQAQLDAEASLKVKVSKKKKIKGGE